MSAPPVSKQLYLLVFIPPEGLALHSALSSRASRLYNKWLWQSELD